MSLLKGLFPSKRAEEERGRIGLKDAVHALRTELLESMKAGEDEKLRFEVGEISLEFQVEVERSGEIDGKVSVWVLEFGAKGSLASTTTHKLTIPLKVKEGVVLD